MVGSLAWLCAALGIALATVTTAGRGTALAGERFASAPPSEREAPADVLVRVGGSVRIGPAERVRTVVVAGGDADVEGEVVDDLVVVGGDARIRGAVDGDVTVVDGRVDLSPTARVGGDVKLYRGELDRAPGASIEGEVQTAPAPRMRWAPAFAFWLSSTMFFVLSGLAFAAVGGRQLSGAAAALIASPGGASVAALLAWVGLPVLAFVSLISVIGIPLGLAILILVMPALWFLGYLVAGATLGRALLPALRSDASSDHPYRAVVAGVLVLQALALIPLVGWVAVWVAGLWGAGALVYRTWRRAETPPVGPGTGAGDRPGV